MHVSPQVFERPERASAVLSLCLRLVPSRHLRSAAAAVQCLQHPLLLQVVAQERVAEAARAVVDLLKHCVEAGCCGAEGGWTLAEHSSSSLDAGVELLQQGGENAASDLQPVTALSAGHAARTSSSSSSVAVVACHTLRSLLESRPDALGVADAAARVVVAEKGLAPLVALLEESVGSAARHATCTAAADAPPAAPGADAAGEKESQQQPSITDDSGSVAELGAAALDCLARMLRLPAAEGVPAQVREVTGVKRVLIKVDQCNVEIVKANMEWLQFGEGGDIAAAG